MAQPTNPAWESNFTNVKKTLFQSPSVQENARGSGGIDSVTEEALMSRLQMEQDISAKLNGLQKELQEQRLSQLRQLLKTVADEDWKYPSVNKLIGLE
ncbi:uncharacterized protein LOC121379260 [Gigantopelta aegis]|uniref:uncharacterized protein LOC121379260 n=1 Tax=Gigantopelta aegis TaxID=1735272 RepID=UPI001B88C569|nr:uncharacterized protein LOC121379260 [Gigantopelta aegis]